MTPTCFLNQVLIFSNAVILGPVQNQAGAVSDDLEFIVCCLVQQCASGKLSSHVGKEQKCPSLKRCRSDPLCEDWLLLDFRSHDSSEELAKTDEALNFQILAILQGISFLTFST